MSQGPHPPGKYVIVRTWEEGKDRDFELDFTSSIPLGGRKAEASNILYAQVFPVKAAFG